MLKEKSADFEIVWVSHDHTSEDFVTYFQQMPWLALAADRVAVEGRQLATLFGVQGIPSLVLLDLAEGVVAGVSAAAAAAAGGVSSGSSSSSTSTSPFIILSSEGVTLVQQDPYALEFPYKPKLSVLKSLVPRTLRRYIRSKKEQSVATVKSAFKKILVKASPINIVKVLLKVLRNRMYAILKLLFPKLVKTNMADPDL